MAEKKRGFHALEKRIHEIEEQDRIATGRQEPGETKDTARRDTPTTAQQTDRPGQPRK